MKRNLVEDEKEHLEKLKRDHEKAPKTNFTNLSREQGQVLRNNICYEIFRSTVRPLHVKQGPPLTFVALSSVFTKKYKK